MRIASLPVVLGLLLVACTSSPPATPTSAPRATQPPASNPPGAAQNGGQVAQSIDAVKPLAQRATLKLAVSSTVVSYLPLLVALEKGYFATAGVDIQEQAFSQSATTQLPLLARGDIDVAPVVPAPATFNQLAQGFDIRLIAALSTPRAGRATDSWLTVRSDLVDQIKTPQDLKGRVIEGGVDGTPLAILAYGAIQQGHLTVGQDVTLAFRLKGPGDMLSIAQSKAADAIGMTEPTATSAEQQGIARRWLSYQDLAPWYQPVLLGASSTFLQAHPDVVEKFLEVYAVTCREVDSANGQWTDELTGIMSKRAGIDAATIRAQGGVPYYDPNVPVSLESLGMTQDLWVKNGQVKEPVGTDQLVNSQPLDQALAAIGHASS
jgi:ABC-type nitrate/sulfonate/bicarbonate transport system substrate-binding protein